MLSRVISGLILALATGAAAGAPPMLVATSPHFTIFAAESEADLRARASGLERYDHLLHRLTQTKDTGEIVPLTIYVMPDQEAVGGGNYVLGFYNPVAAGPYAVLPRKLPNISVVPLAQIVLFHEYAHHFMLQNFATLYSPWFVEGFAEFYSSAEVAGAMATVGKPEPFRIRDLMSRWTSPLSHLLVPGDKPLTIDQTEQLYARGWLLVHYLTLSKERGGQIENYLRARGGGQTEEQAFQSAFHTSIAGMDKELKSYFSGHQLTYVGLDIPDDGTIVIRAATPGEVAVAKLTPRLRALQDMRRDADDPKSSVADRVLLSRLSEKLAIDGRAAARQLPSDAAVQETSAESEMVAGQLDLARASAEDALRLAPKEGRAHLVLADVALARIQAGDKGGLAAARQDIVIANRTSPEDPMPLIAYYESFAEHGEAPPPIAVRGLERAQQLAPQDDQVRVMLAKEEIGLKRYAMAADLLRPVAFAPHDSSRRKTAQSLLKTLPIQQEEAPSTVSATPAEQARGATTTAPRP